MRQKFTDIYHVRSRVQISLINSELVGGELLRDAFGNSDGHVREHLSVGLALWIGTKRAHATAAERVA